MQKQVSASPTSPPARRAWRVWLAVAFCAWSVVVTVGGAQPAWAQEWQPPVSAPVIDGFRPPESRFGSGNRGLEYDLPAGSLVRAVAAGTVSFSGTIGAQRFVVVQHDDGLRSTYAYVSELRVIRGQRVTQGQVVATAGAGFHLTARLGDSYVDPALLFAGAVVGVALTDGVPPPVSSQSANVLQGTSRLGTNRPSALPGMLQSVGELTTSSMVRGLADGASAWANADCTRDSVAVGDVGGDRIAVQVGGLGSSSDDASIGALDLAGMGYATENIVGFSYAGGCTPEGFDLAPSSEGSLADELTSSTYGPNDTYSDLYGSARRLADLIDEIAATRPGVPIDIAAHSLGGVVTRLALEELARRHDGVVPVAVAVTISSPHGGADLGTASTIANSSGAVSSAVGHIMGDEGDLLAARSVEQVAEAGPDHLAPPAPPPEGVRVVAIAGSTDLIVPAEAARWDGVVNSLVDTGILSAGATHSNLPGRAEVARELALAVAGMAPRCVGLGTVVRGSAEAAVVDAVENTASVLVGIATWVF